MSSDSKPFLRKVAKFVANPTTDWMTLDAPASKFDAQELGKAEIKAMIERRKRNDFVRKRELDMLRRIRRQNSSPDGTISGSFPSAIDSGLKMQEVTRSSDSAVKAKIDAIEQQMVGGGSGQVISTGFSLDSTQFDTLPQKLSPATYISPPVISPPIAEQVLQQASAITPEKASSTNTKEKTEAQHHAVVYTSFSETQGVLVNAWTHDAELDEAVMAFANADFELCEQQLTQLIQAGASRQDHSDTWMALLDLYRVLDMPSKFDALAMSFVHRFGLSAPQWYALPERVAAHLKLRQSVPSSFPEENISESTQHPSLAVNELPKTIEGWIAPLHLNEDAVSRLHFEVLQLPRPWALDWAGIETINVHAAQQLIGLLKNWSSDIPSMTWIGVDQLFKLLEEYAPTGSRDVDPIFWMLRLELLRFCNRADHFDEVAIDYCITYEQSPPSWEPCACQVKLLADATCTQSIHLSHISDVSTSFVESQMFDDTAMIEVATLELSGQLIGDIEVTLIELEKQLGSSVAVALDCTHLIRVDFVAAGDLLNWVLGRRAEHRSVEFISPHRLIALFFGAMGITEHAKIQLQTV